MTKFLLGCFLVFGCSGPEGVVTEKHYIPPRQTLVLIGSSQHWIPIPECWKLVYTEGDECVTREQWDAAVVGQTQKQETGS